MNTIKKIEDFFEQSRGIVNESERCLATIVALKALTSHPMVSQEGVLLERVFTHLEREELVLTGRFIATMEEFGVTGINRADLMRGTLDLEGRLTTIKGENLWKVLEAIGTLTFLESLNLSGNELTYLPPAIWRLKELKILDASNNKIPSISHEISSLARLETVDLSHNELETVPTSLSFLANLKTFNLRDNRLIPQEKSAIAHVFRKRAML